MSDLEQSEVESIISDDDNISIDSQENIQPINSNKKSINNFNNDTNISYDSDDNEGLDEDLAEEDNLDEDNSDEDNSDEENIDQDQYTKNNNTNDSISKINISNTINSNITFPTNFENNDSDYDSDEDESDDDNYLQKFDTEIREKYIQKQHPESIVHNYNEIYNMSKVTRNKDNIIIDELHKTIPILTKFEKSRILGIRAKQLNNGAPSLTAVPSNVMDGYLIALKELEEKVIPVIIRRPLPSGGSEYWRIKDLEII
tara:strand:- start:172 stop:945 length:774 start_codon:yes stop_codon:yes gene_type:complete